MIAGLSAGGFGAMDIGLRHPDMFGAIEAWSGYFTPLRDGPFKGASRKVLAANDPARLARHKAALLRADGTRFFLSTGPFHSHWFRPEQTIEFTRELRSLQLPVRYHRYANAKGEWRASSTRASSGHSAALTRPSHVAPRPHNPTVRDIRAAHTLGPASHRGPFGVAPKSVPRPTQARGLPPHEPSGLAATGCNHRTRAPEQRATQVTLLLHFEPRCQAPALSELATSGPGTGFGLRPEASRRSARGGGCGPGSGSWGGAWVDQDRGALEV